MNPPPPWAARGPSPEGRLPSPRPTWMVTLSSLMFVWAMVAFLSGLNTLQSLGRPLPKDREPPPGLSEPDVLQRRLDNAREDFERSHPRSTRGLAVANLALAGVLLFAVAAVAMNDPRGRRAALVAGWTGIAFHVGNSAFFLLVLRPGFMAQVVPRVADAVIGVGETAAGPPDRLIEQARAATLVLPLVMAAIGIGFSALVLRYFGGRRGRAFYGVDADLAPRPGGAVG